MGDFFQNANFATLHNLHNRKLPDIETELIEFSKTRPIGLIIPALYTELNQPALANIVNILKDIEYISQIVIGLDAANATEFKHAKDFFSILPQQHRVLWNDGPGIKKLEFSLNEHNFHLGTRSKAKNLWLCMGYMVASNKSEVIAMHDAHIFTYSREMVARLVYPVVNPNFNYKYCKGYYYRTDSEKLNGRIVRLLIGPFIQTLKQYFGSTNYINLIEGFRYILAGENAMRSDVAKNIKIPGDWGIEMGILAEVLNSVPINRICQVEIADQYDHRHQTDSFENPEKGLSKMGTDIVRTIISQLATEGIVFTDNILRSIKATYYQNALIAIEKYYCDAVLNGLTLDCNNEEKLAEQLSRIIYQTGVSFLNNPNQPNIMPSWKRVFSTITNIKQKFVNVVDTDNKS